MTREIAVSVRPAAAIADVSESTIREAISKHELPAYRVGNSIRVVWADLDRWLRGQAPRVASEGAR